MPAAKSKNMQNSCLCVGVIFQFAKNGSIKYAFAWSVPGEKDRNYRYSN